MCIDDEPDDGADHYIFIYGFHFPHLFGLMAELGLHVANIICVNSQDYTRFEAKDADEQPIEKDEKTLGMALYWVWNKIVLLIND